MGIETWWDMNGRKVWEKSYAPDGTWTWRYENAGSKWKGKELLDARL